MDIQVLSSGKRSGLEIKIWELTAFLVIFKAMGLDEIIQGENVERKKQQAPEGMLQVSNNRGRGEGGRGRAGSDTEISLSIGERRGQHG